MAGRLGKFQMVSFSTWKGMSSEKHLGSAFGLQPQKLANVMVQLQAATRGKTLDSQLSQFATKTFESDDEFTWDVVGSAQKNIPLLWAKDEDGTAVTSAGSMVGAGTAPFTLAFAEDYFADGEVIVGNFNEAYQFRILGEPEQQGTNFVYKVELMGGNTAGVPSERLLQGERFSVEFAPVEKELSRKVGDIRFATPTSMRNEWSRIRLQHKEPGSMLDQKIAVGIPMVREVNGVVKREITDMWMTNVEWTFENQWADYKNHVLLFGRSNRNSNGEYMNFGKSGNAIKLGAGLYEQMEYANTFYYNTFSLKLLEDVIYNLTVGKTAFGERHFEIRTGEYGALQFHKAVLTDVSGWTQFVTNQAPSGVQKTTSELHQNAMKAGFQFVEYMAPNGVIVTIKVDPSYDDQVRNKIQHPNGGVANSYRYDIFDMGTSSEPNIFKCVLKNNPEIRGFQPGLRNPFTGLVNNNFMAYDEDSAVAHAYATLGICVLDPTRTVSLIPAILQY